MNFALRDEVPWALSEEFLQLSSRMFRPATPLLFDSESLLVLTDSNAICEYFEEIRTEVPLFGANALERAEARRIVALFDQKFFLGVTAPLLDERIKKRLVTREAPDSGVLRQALRSADAFLSEIDNLIALRPWLAGPNVSVADLAASAQISVADQLGGLDWARHEITHTWYSAMTNRPSFRALSNNEFIR